MTTNQNNNRAWQRMLSGRRLDLLDPRPADIEVSDIAHGLARVARWNGQTIGDHAFSVAQHSLLVERILSTMQPGCDTSWQLMALLHDAPEYVVGDLISPFKAAIGLDYRTFERRLLQAIHLRFGLPVDAPAEAVRRIKSADRVAAYFEATVLAGFQRTEAEQFFGPIDVIPPALARELGDLHAWPTAAAQKAFLARFDALRSS